ncbi:SH3 domain-containing protein [Jannaschia sp. LMIT008]|uniref:SH3 domain-containing protein n=1 Tax=Jannaschia maritima TaxID=3032585 RepID=UPI002810EEEA|nr:SH3 domain-containing protein [Jannaschia sp. LMIT008]
MLRLTFTLAAALFAGLSIWGEPEEAVLVAEAPSQAPAIMAANAAEYDRPVILDTQASTRGVVTRDAVAGGSGIAVPDAAVIAASTPDPGATYTVRAPIGEPVRISLIAEPAADTALDPAIGLDAQASGGAADMLVVTGSRVNLRAGPSTQNRVVGSLTEGTRVERIADDPSGWVELRDPATGQTGFMSGRFLAPA